MKVSKIKIDKFGTDYRYVDIKGSNFSGTVWSDGTGQFKVIANGEIVFLTEDGFYHHKLEYIKEEISRREKELKILKRVYKEASTLNIKEIFKR